MKPVLGDVVVVKTVPMSSFSVALIYRGNLRDSPNAHPKKYGLVQGLLTFTYSLLIVPEQGLISWGGWH